MQPSPQLTSSPAQSSMHGRWPSCAPRVEYARLLIPYGQATAGPSQARSGRGAASARMSRTATTRAGWRASWSAPAHGWRWYHTRSPKVFKQPGAMLQRSASSRTARRGAPCSLLATASRVALHTHASVATSRQEGSARSSSSAPIASARRAAASAPLAARVALALGMVVAGAAAFLLTTAPQRRAAARVRVGAVGRTVPCGGGRWRARVR
mmetsp:Transcript_12470/g.38539  ORF Transcript_12470/g.38539 Transcript_12470/m.38539 type:complete len:211 (+) Transcript_12470:1918-2550(+)